MEKMGQDEVSLIADSEEVEGYTKCQTKKDKCLTDCWPFGNSLISDIQ